MDSSYTLPAFIAAAVVLALILIIRLRGLRSAGRDGMDPGLIGSLSKTALVKYKPTTRFEKVVEGLVKSYIAKGSYVLLVSSAPRADFYAGVFAEPLDNEKLMMIKVSASPKTDRFYLTAGDSKKEGKIAEISVDWMEYLSEVVEGLPEDSVIVFEPLSDLILMNGFEKTFKFIKKTLDYCVGAGIQMISLINDDAHEETVKASFEGLFTNILNVVNDRLELIK